MNDRDRRAAKYLPFDSLKGLKEAILEEDERSKRDQIPMMSEEEKFQMNLILFECYSKNRAITLSYFEHGRLKECRGVIQKIDILNRQIILLPKKKFSLDDIYRISMR